MTASHSTTWIWPAWYNLTQYAGGNGQLLQNTDEPNLYHKYELAWPMPWTAKSQATRRGVQHLDMPIFQTTLPASASDSIVII